MSFYEQWGAFAILALAGMALYALIMLINRIMRPSVPSPLKLSTYECGVAAEGFGWSQMNIRYYVFAFMFVIFDVETVFVFPWAVILGGLDETTVVSPMFALVEMGIFVGILAVGLLYAWRKKVLVWE
ncbi:MAG: NADH-quinone oxidoreductase subunit A [Glaciecola sp.]